MRLQVIRYSNGSTSENDGVLLSPMRCPRALDDYDVNIIDLSVKEMWKYNSRTRIGEVDSKPDLLTVRQMVQQKRNAIVVYVLPQNINYSYNDCGTHKSVPLKDIIRGFFEHSIEKVIANTTLMPAIAYEKTCTTIRGKEYEADFYLINPTEVITCSERSQKPTTVQIDENVFVTTLEITKSVADIQHYVSALFEKQPGEAAPEWVADISFADDDQQKSQIERGKNEILAAQAKIEAAENKLAENAKYKSILYTNGDELVGVVFDILEKILAYDLSAFVDDKKEDFLIKLPSCTFIGEIKGVTSNVKYEHISQVELHYRGYLDRLAETGTAENVKQLLIMNPFRTKVLDKREPIHTAQIDLAVRNGCLIIETSTLLRVYEKFCNGEVMSQKCIDVLASKTGLLSLADFDENA